MASEWEKNLSKLIGAKIDATEVIEKLDANQLQDLLDAASHKDAETAKRILGDLTKSENEKDDDGDVEDDEELSVLLKSKEEAKKSSKKKKHILKKSTQGRDAAENTLTHRIGDNVAVEGEEATVKSPKAPGGTVGVMIDGELKMVDKKDVHKLGEGVLGMTGVPALQRIKELAGIGGDDVEGDVTNIGVPPAQDMGADDTWPNTPVPAGMEVEPEVDPVADVPAPVDAGLDGEMGMDDGMGDDLGMDAPMPDAIGLDAPDAGLAPEAPLTPAPAPVPGLPGLPGLPGEDDAAKLDQAFADIEALIPNVKISDFKSVVARLNGLVTLATNTGRAALTESRRHMSFDDQDRSERSREDDWLFGNPDEDDDDVSDFLPKHSRKGFAEDDHFDSQDRRSRRSEDDWMLGNPDDDDDDISDFLPKHSRKGFAEDDHFDAQDRRSRRSEDDWMLGAPDDDDDMSDLDFLPARKRRPFAEDSIGAKDVVSRARDIVAKGGEAPKKKKDDNDSEVGRKTLFDYMKEAEQDDETIGVNRAEAAKSIQNRMGGNANPKDANDALDSMLKTGSVKQQGGRFMMDPMDDEQVQGSIAQAKAAQKPQQQQPSNSGNFQGSNNNGKYQ